MILKNNKRIDGCSDTVPIGTLNSFLGSTAPYGYLLCQGQKVSKITYKELYEICGDTFGQSTDTEFYLPDLRGQTIAGYKEGDSTFGTLGGLIGNLTHLHSTGNHTLTTDEIPEHNHNVHLGLQSIRLNGQPSWNTVVTAADAGSGITGGNIGTQKWSNATNNSQLYVNGKSSVTGASQPHNHGDTSSNSSLQPTMTLNWIVKAFQLMPNQSYVENSLESDSTINSLSAAKGKELNEKIIGSKSNIQVGDNLKGQTIYFYFPPDMEEITEDYSPIIESYDSDTGTTELLLYRAITSEIRIRYIYSDGTAQTVTKDLVMGDWSGSFTMGGTVTSIDTSCPLYNYFYLKNVGLEDRVKTLEEGENYSINEQRIGTWVDGKLLYRQTFKINIGTATSGSILHAIENIEDIWVDQGNSHFINGIYKLTAGHYGGANDWSRFYVTNDKIFYQFGTTYSNLDKTAYITVCYTKTTD